MDTLEYKLLTREPLHYPEEGKAIERFEIRGHGDKGDSLRLPSTRLYDLEIEGSIYPFKWEQDGPDGALLTLAEKWLGYMLIPVIGRRNG